MTSALAEVLEKLERAVALVADMTPGELDVYDANEGDGWPPRPLWCFKNEGYDSGDDPALQGSIHYGGKEDADAIVAAVNFLREHGPALLRDAGDGEKRGGVIGYVGLITPSQRGAPDDVTIVVHTKIRHLEGFGDKLLSGPVMISAIDTAMHAPGGSD